MVSYRILGVITVKKLYLFLCLLLLTIVGNSQSTTPNIGLQIPAAGSNNWNLPLNYNFNVLDQLFGGIRTIPSLKATTICIGVDCRTSWPVSGSGINQLTGDVLGGPGTGSQATTVVGVNGASIPTSASIVGTNSSNRFVSVTATQLITFIQSLTGCNTSGNVLVPKDVNCITPSGGGSVNVNGSSVSSPNFNGTTPAAPTGATNQIYQVSGSNVSSYDYSVQYNDPLSVYAWMADSSIGSDDHALSTTVTVSAVTYTGSGSITTVTMTTSSTAILTTLQTAYTQAWIDTQGITSPTFLNTGNCITSYNVASTGVCLFPVTIIDSTHFSFVYPSNQGTGSGTGGTAYTANAYLPIFTQLTQPFFKNHGVMAMKTDIIFNASTNFATDFANVTALNAGHPHYLIMANDQDIYFPSFGGTCTSAAIEGYYKAVWTAAHTAGYQVIQTTTRAGSQNTSVGACSGATVLWQTVELWKRGMKCNANSSVGTSACIDTLVDQWAVTGGEQTNAYQVQGRPTYAGVAVLSSLFNDVLASKQSPSPANTDDALIPNGGGWDLNLTTANGTSFRICVSGTCYANLDTTSGRFSFSFINLAALCCDQGSNGDLWYNGTDIKARAAGTVYNLTHPSTTGLSGMTSGQVAIANGATTVGSSKALAGSGAGITTGPTSSTTIGHAATFADTVGTLQDSGAAPITAVTPTSPIVASITGTTLSVSCPTCGTSSGGTNVSQNSGSTETNLPITGFMPQVCSDSSGSGTVQFCTVANTFVPQAGNCLVYKTTTANSGTGLTLNVNSLGAKSVAVASSSGWTTTLVASTSIPANKPMNVCYDGTNWNASGTGYIPSSSSTTIPYVYQYTFVSQQGGSLASITSPSITIASGSLVYTFCRGGATPTSILTTDSRGNTWTATGLFNVAATNYVEASYSFVTTGGAGTFTCTPNTSIASQSMIVMEIRNPPASISGTASATQSGASNTFIGAYALVTSQRTFNILCADIASTGSSFSSFDAQGFYYAPPSAQDVSTIYAGGADSGCGVFTSVGALPSLSARAVYGSSAGNWVGVVSAFNY